MQNQNNKNKYKIMKMLESKSFSTVQLPRRAGAENLSHSGVNSVFPDVAHSQLILRCKKYACVLFMPYLGLRDHEEGDW